MKNVIFWLLVLLAVALLLYLNFFKKTAEEDTPRIIFTEDAPKPIGPYSQAVSSGNAVFVSGQIGLDPVTGELDTTSIETETKRVLENIRAILNAVKLDMRDVVKSTIYMTDLKDFKRMNEIYLTYFKSDYPARETVQVVALPKGAHIEISVVAIKQ